MKIRGENARLLGRLCQVRKIGGENAWLRSGGENARLGKKGKICKPRKVKTTVQARSGRYWQA